MRNSIIVVAALLLAACGTEQAATEAPAPTYSAADYSAAIADIARPEEDRERDADRKPGELLAFAQIDPGDVVGDFAMGGGYVTRLLAIAVGNTGKVYAFQPSEFIAAFPSYAKDQDDAVAPYADENGKPIHVFPLRAPLTEPGWPEPLDTIITVMNYHDLYLNDFPPDLPEKTMKSLFDALKPGGTLIVVDHSSVDGADAKEVANSLHRGNRQAILDLATAAGFVLDGEGDLYSRPDDPRTANVFNPSIRGKTDQFALRLRKPE